MCIPIDELIKKEMRTEQESISLLPNSYVYKIIFPGNEWYTMVNEHRKEYNKLLSAIVKTFIVKSIRMHILNITISLLIALSITKHKMNPLQDKFYCKSMNIIEFQ